MVVQEERESISKKIAKQQARKQAKKLLKKGGKAAAKVAAKAALAGMKALISFLLGLGAPFLLGTLAVLAALFGIYLAITLMFSIGSDLLDGEEKEFYEYVVQQADATVDMSKDEQRSYRVPHELIIASLQIYDSTKHGKTDKEAVKIMAKALTPIFTYEEKEGKIETETTTCVTGEGCKTVTEITPFKLNMLTSVDAWNQKMVTTITGERTDWVTANSSTTTKDKDGKDIVTSKSVKSRAHTFVPVNEIEEDYTHFDRVLSDIPFDYKETDKKTAEALYQASGGTINYSEWLNGDSLAGSGFGDIGDIGSDVNVSPGSNVPAEYMKYYLAGQKKYGIDWYYLAAFHFVETTFSTLKPMISSVGAIGHTQLCAMFLYKRSCVK